MKIATLTEGLTGERGARSVHLITLACAFGFLLYSNRNQWFYRDEWEFFTRRGVAGVGDRSIWDPYNGHWTTIPILIYRAMAATVGLEHPLAYVVPVLLAHVLAAHLLWRICLRQGVRAWTATSVVSTFLVLGAGSANLLWSFQITIVGSVTLGLAALLAVDRPGGARTWLILGWLAAVGSLMCSGVGLPMVALAAAVLVARHGWGWALRFVSVPAVVQTAWQLSYGRNDPATRYQVEQDTVANMMQFVIRGISYALGTWTGVESAGGVLVLVILVLTVRQIAAGGPGLTTGILGLGIFPLYLLFAFSRIGLGVDAGVAGRYAYVGVALVLPAVAVAVDSLCLAPRQIAIPVTLSIFSVLAGMSSISISARLGENFERPGREAVTGAQILALRGERILPPTLDPDHQQLPRTAAFLELNRRGLRVSTSGFSEADLLRARTYLQLSLSPAADSQLAGLRIDATQGVQISGSTGDCATLTNLGQARVQGPTGNGSTLSLTAPTASTATVSLLAPDGTTASRTFDLRAGVPEYLTVAAPGLRVAIDLPAGTTRVCTPGVAFPG